MKLRIVITDGFTLNPGDLSWKALDELGEVIYYDRTPVDEVLGRCRNATVIITNKTPVSSAVMEAAGKLKLIAVTATGYNVIDIAAAKKKGITVCNVPAYGTHSVAQHTFALLLELSNHAGANAASVQAGEWYRSPDWCYSKQPLTELKNKIIGIIGLGKIGTQVAMIAMAFGMKVIYFHGKKGLKDWTPVKLHELFMQADFISVHCPLTEDNRGFINKEMLELMKPTGFLINTSRGQLIVEKDLAGALQKRKLAGAALDVLSAEPPLPGHPLIGLPNCIITPHNAWISFEARSSIMQTTVENVKAALKGHPQNEVGFR
ncbi:MAG: D-2-hydroxyacid dehydrogenase [Ferruginibacter sp.]|nr:D-2-hydroxyacid dehydrogenase [Ferruginibacter sp.]